MPTRFVAFLLRELVIFFSLIGGELALSLVRGVVQEFGNPKSVFYTQARDKAMVGQGIKLLQVAARGLKRFTDPLSMELRLRVSCREEEFLALDRSSAAHKSMVHNIMHRLVQMDG